jgi:hypothetical protein
MAASAASFGDSAWTAFLGCPIHLTIAPQTIAPAA